MNTLKLPAGTVLYHGTDCDDFDEENDSLNGPAWVTSSRSVAERFASRSGGWGGRKRIIEYVLAVDVDLPEIVSMRDMAAFTQEHGISLGGVEEMRDSIADSGLPGWIIPGNYPDGDDILLVETDVLDFVGSKPLLNETPSPRSSL